MSTNAWMAQKKASKFWLKRLFKPSLEFSFDFSSISSPLFMLNKIEILVPEETHTTHWLLRWSESLVSEDAVWREKIAWRAKLKKIILENDMTLFTGFPGKEWIYPEYIKKPLVDASFLVSIRRLLPWQFVSWLSQDVTAAVAVTATWRRTRSGSRMRSRGRTRKRGRTSSRGPSLQPMHHPL